MKSSPVVIVILKFHNCHHTDVGTPLHLVAETGNFDICKYIIDSVEDKNPKDFLDWTPLHWAAQEGNKNICILILENVDEKNPIEKKGMTPLRLALQNNQFEEVRNRHNANITMKR